MNGIIASSLIFMLVVFTVVLFSMRAIRPWINRYISWRRNVILAGVYIAVLIVLVPICLLLPRREFMQTSGDRESDQTVMVAPIGLMNGFPLDGNLDQIKGIYRNSNQTFKLDKDKLTFDDSARKGNYKILVKRKAIDDGQIEVSTYITGYFVGKLDFTELVLPPSIFIQKGILSIEDPSPQNLNFIAFTADFTLNQFKHLNLQPNDSFSSQLGMRLIYLSVPKSLEIDNETKNVIMVN